jgi:hypothetical protein
MIYNRNKGEEDSDNKHYYLSAYYVLLVSRQAEQTLSIKNRT